MTTYRHAMILSFGILTSGCASWFMNGGKLVEDDYKPTVSTAFKAPTCTNLVDGLSIAGPPGVTFKLVQDAEGKGLFEESPDGTGAVITNRWSDEKGEHFFGWVQSSGWEYVIPADASQKPMRVIYTGLQTREEGTVTKPVSSPTATCELVAGPVT